MLLDVMKAKFGNYREIILELLALFETEKKKRKYPTAFEHILDLVGGLLDLGSIAFGPFTLVNKYQNDWLSFFSKNDFNKQNYGKSQTPQCFLRDISKHMHGRHKMLRLKFDLRPKCTWLL